MRHKSGPATSVDTAVAEVATRQHGVVTATQLAAAGLDRNAVARRVRAGRLHRMHQGVYAVGHGAPSRERSYMAAVLACGSGAVLSHRSAAVLWDLLRPEKDEPVHVSLASRSGRFRGGEVRIHRPRSLAPSDLTRRSGIPVTTPSRTILDLRASRLEPRLLRRAIRQAELARYKLNPSIDRDRTRSDLERDFLRLCRRHRIPEPIVNLRLAADLTVDFVWPAAQLAVETDSYEYHQGSISFEDDHVRDLRLRRRGFTVLRYTGRQLDREAALVAAEIATRLAP